MAFFVVALVFVMVLGFLAQTTGLCLVRGVNEAVTGKPLFLLAIIFSGSFAWIAVLAATSLDLAIPFISYQVSSVAIVGGLLFGLGATFNNGCGVSTISKLARGQVVMFATISGWLIGWLVLLFYAPTQELVPFTISDDWHYCGLFAVSIFVALFVTRLKSPDRKIWISMLLIGLMASIAFLYEAKWTPSGLLRDVSLSVWHKDPLFWPSVERFSLAAALIGGMLIAALWSHSFKIEGANWPVVFRHLFAGILMGVGAAVASGGNDSQLLLALPALSPAGGVTVLSMLGGIYLGRVLIGYFGSRVR